MHRLAALLLLPAALSAPAQQLAQPTPPPPPAGSNWQHVQMLPTGTSIYVYTRGRHQRCELASADADTLTCIHGKSATFQRTEITSIKLAHRGRSAWIGLAVGAGAGIGIGYGIAASQADPVVCDGFFGCTTIPNREISKPLYSAMGAVVGMAIVTPVSYFTDFTRSTVYKAP